MVDAVYMNNAHALTDDSGVYFEGICEARTDLQGYRTDYAVGSRILCVYDWSVWLLVRENGDKKWTEATGVTWSLLFH